VTVSKQLKRAVFGAWSLLALGGWAPGGWATPGADSTAIPSVVGRLEVLDGIASSELPQPRRAWVLLPPDYDPARRYAVLYATDGQDLFDEAMAPGGEELGLDELFAARPAGIAPLLVVGLEASAHALLEYSPPGTRDGACADALVRLLTEAGVPPGRMVAIGYADNKPLDTNATVDGRARNRRVNVLILNKVGDAQELLQLSI